MEKDDFAHVDMMRDKLYSSNINSPQRDIFDKLINFRDRDLNMSLDFLIENYSGKHEDSLMRKAQYQKTISEYRKKGESDILDEFKSELLVVAYNNEFY